ncbi:deoxycytidylate deaminase [Perkinsela sp. CCAP 1560/4]|nr:deoxycytidylate deaminase [Perkinsela sp. CCAP 1560/4]|eukprot:KNH09642.1 deoxycytidylate deaminase [Perkinsela sp. CCAP 1560/4]
MKRTDYISFDDYFMSIAVLSSQRSKDPQRQVGSCIVNKFNRIVGIGYNGFPTGCSDEELPWAGRRTLEASESAQLTVTHALLSTKYPYVCHAELNAITNSGADLRGCRIFTTLFPCNECAKLIIQSGITNVLYMSDKNHAEPSWIASRRLFDMTGVQYQQHVPSITSITLNLTDPAQCESSSTPPEKPKNWIPTVVLCANICLVIGSVFRRMIVSVAQ